MGGERVLAAVVVDQMCDVPVQKAANHVAAQDVVREAEVDAACVIKPIELGGGNLEVDGGKVLLKLLEPTGADNGNRDVRLVE